MTFHTDANLALPEEYEGVTVRTASSAIASTVCHVKGGNQESKVLLLGKGKLKGVKTEVMW